MSEYIERSPNEMHVLLTNNDELRAFELSGFITGAEKGKTMNVSINEVVESYEKQAIDFMLCWNEYLRTRLREKQKLIPKGSSSKSLSRLKRCLADVRNLAGCVFLKIQEMERQKVQEMEQI